jgi:SEC-C motif-containing protein
MRSRFTAYALQNAAYLLDTWDAAMRPTSIDFSEENVNWLRLEIISTKKGGAFDTKGMVEFKAYYWQEGQECVMHEASKFIKHDGNWFYRDGLVKTNGKESLRPGMNAPCPCGSGKKFKRCCGK